MFEKLRPHIGIDLSFGHYRTGKAASWPAERARQRSYKRMQVILGRACPVKDKLRLEHVPKAFECQQALCRPGTINCRLGDARASRNRFHRKLAQAPFHKDCISCVEHGSPRGGTARPPRSMSRRRRGYLVMIHRLVRNPFQLPSSATLRTPLTLRYVA